MYPFFSSQDAINMKIRLLVGGLHQFLMFHFPVAENNNANNINFFEVKQNFMY